MRKVLWIAVLVLAGCSDLFSTKADMVATAAGHELSVEQLGDWLSRIKGLQINPDAAEFLATVWFAHLMTAEQVDTVIKTKLEEINEFLEMIEAFQPGNCPGTGQGAQFVAGYGKHMGSAFKQYIEQNRHLLTEPELRDAKSAAG